MIRVLLRIHDPFLYLRIHRWLADYSEVQIVDETEYSPDLLILDQIPHSDPIVSSSMDLEDTLISRAEYKTAELANPEWILIGPSLKEQEGISVPQRSFLFHAFDVIIECDDSMRFHTAVDAFLQWKRGLRRGIPLDQDSMDRIRKQRVLWLQNLKQETEGFDPQLFREICHTLEHQSNRWFTVSELSEEQKRSKTTLRKYLEKLEESESIRSRMRYGKGRPSREYTINHHSSELYR